MCELCNGGTTRRAFLAGALGVAAPLAMGTLGPAPLAWAGGSRPRQQPATASGAGVVTGSSSPSARQAVPQPPVVPRSEWGGDLPQLGPLEPEAPGDVRFLLVHHSASSNDYAPQDTAGILRGFYEFHTGERGWPDIAYNFFVDRHGTIYEGRTGSLVAPMKVDATGGSQGFAQLCCLVGDHTTEAPTEAASGALVALLAWLASTHGIDPTRGATASFISRGSNRWPVGTTVTTATIAGHRDMSETSCPGDAAYELVSGRYPREVAAALGLHQADPQSTTTSSAPPTTAPPAETLDTAPPDTSPVVSVAPSTPANAPGQSGAGAGQEPSVDMTTRPGSGDSSGVPVELVVASAAFALVGGLLLRLLGHAGERPRTAGPSRAPVAPPGTAPEDDVDRATRIRQFTTAHPPIREVAWPPRTRRRRPGGGGDPPSV